MSEKELKELGEELAEAAAKADIGVKQLRDLYRIAKTRSIPFLEAYVKRQIPRARRRGGPKGFDKFGPAMLDIIERFQEDKGGLQKVLEYANMLHDYIKMTMARGAGVGREWRDKLEPIVQNFCSGYGYWGLTLEDDRGQLFCRVRLRKFRGDPRRLASDLYNEVVSHFPELTGSIRFWIERT